MRSCLLLTYIARVTIDRSDAIARIVAGIRVEPTKDRPKWDDIRPNNAITALAVARHF